MKCQNLFSVKNKKNISICRLLKILPRVLVLFFFFYLCGERAVAHVPVDNTAINRALHTSLVSRYFSIMAVNADLAKERNNATFDPEKLTEVIYGGKTNVRRRRYLRKSPRIF